MRVIKHLKCYFQDTYHASPALFFGTLEQAVNAALHPDSIEDVRLAL
jgi:hypothetical protein